METIIINSIDQYIAGNDFLPETDFYRGMPNEEYKLIASIGRLQGNLDAILQIEQKLLDDFERKLPLFADYIPKDKIELMCYAQHYGLPTRLLDWTYNPLIALYFAVCSDFDCNGVVYQAVEYNHLIVDASNVFISQDYQSYIIPKLTNVRYKNQNGLFTICSNPTEEFNNRNILKKYIIPSHMKASILWKLYKIGVTKSFIYDSLDSLSSDIVYKYKKQYPYIDFSSIIGNE